MQSPLITEIELIRDAMIDMAFKKGLSAQETLTLSRKLDNLLNQVILCAKEKENPN